MEIQVKYPSNHYGKPIKWKKRKHKVEYRIYDKNENLIEIGKYGERGGYTESNWNPIDSTLEIKHVSTRNIKNLDFVEFFYYNDSSKLTKRTFWYCRNNQPIYLSYKDTFDYEENFMESTVFDFDGNVTSSKISKIEYPIELNQEIFNQKITSDWERIFQIKKEEFQYDNQNRLIKILYKDDNDYLLGYTKYKYKEIRKHGS